MTDLPKIKKTVTVEEEHQLYLSVDCSSFVTATLEDVRAVLDAAGYLVVEKRIKLDKGDVEDLRREAAVEYTHERTKPLEELRASDVPRGMDPDDVASPVGNPASGSYVFLRDGKYWRRTPDGREVPYHDAGKGFEDLYLARARELSLEFEQRPSMTDEQDAALYASCRGFIKGFAVSAPLKTSGTADGVSGSAEEAAINSRPAECREEPGTQFTMQEMQDWFKKTAEGVKDLFGEGERMRNLALSVRVGLAKRDWGVIKEGLFAYDGIKTGGMTVEPECREEPGTSPVGNPSSGYYVFRHSDGRFFCRTTDGHQFPVSLVDDGATVGAALLQQKLDEAKRVASNAISGLTMLGQYGAADALRERLGKL